MSTAPPRCTGCARVVSLVCVVRRRTAKTKSSSQTHTCRPDDLHVLCVCKSPCTCCIAPTSSWTALLAVSQEVRQPPLASAAGQQPRRVSCSARAAGRCQACLRAAAHGGQRLDATTMVPCWMASSHGQAVSVLVDVRHRAKPRLHDDPRMLRDRPATAPLLKPARRVPRLAGRARRRACSGRAASWQSRLAAKAAASRADPADTSHAVGRCRGQPSA